MNADEYKNYILGFIFYKYLSERLSKYVNDKLLASENYSFEEIKENTKKGKEIIEAVKQACLGHLGYFLNPSELFHYLVKKGNNEIKAEENFILEDLKKSIKTAIHTNCLQLNKKIKAQAMQRRPFRAFRTLVHPKMTYLCKPVFYSFKLQIVPVNMNKTKS